MMGKDPTLDIPRLSDPAYYAERAALYAADPNRWAWYVRVHVHTCRRCAKRLSHTGLEAERDGLPGHLCCGHDVRLP
jgi:hypothetical protein